MEAERRGRAMGSDFDLIVVVADESPESTAEERAERLADAAVTRLVQLEQRWSRFLPTSEISQLNASYGRPVAVSSETVELLTRGLEAKAISGGLVDLGLLNDVVAAGYDRSFGDIPTDRAEMGRTPIAPLFEIDDIVFEQRPDGGVEVCVPAGLGLDPGGIGKGLAADIVANEAMAGGADGFCISVGGDLRVEGMAPEGDGWTIAIEHPSSDQPIALIGLRSGAVASSTTLRRHWRMAGRPAHHLIDPRTHRPSTSPVVFASAVASTGWQAETLAKAALLGGSPLSVDGVETLTVTEDGAIATSAGFINFTGGRAVDTHLTGRSGTSADTSSDASSSSPTLFTSPTQSA